MYWYLLLYTHIYCVLIMHLSFLACPYWTYTGGDCPEEGRCQAACEDQVKRAVEARRRQKVDRV